MLRNGRIDVAARKYEIMRMEVLSIGLLICGMVFRRKVF